MCIILCIIFAIMIKRKIKEKKTKNLKKILLLLWLVFLISAFVFLPNVAFADSNPLVQNDVYIDWISEFIKIISHIVYVFIWPCLAIAGSALDNSLIYGSFLHLDAALWNIWNIMKNFANFTLWFVFILTIVKNLFKWSFGGADGDPIKGAKDTIVKTLIAWVLVQMSWFVVAALIDLSTILIYAVWWIPLSMLWSYDHHISEMPIMKLNAEFDENNISYYYSYWWHNYSPCILANKGWDAADKLTLQYLSWEYIAWREYLYMSSWSRFESWYCVLNWYLYKYVESTWFFNVYQESWNATYLEKNTAYLTQIKNYWVDITWAQLSERDACSLVRAYNKEYTWSNGEQCQQICTWYWEIPYTGDVFSGANGFTLQQLMENSKWWVWPFVTMYSSILRYQDLVINPGSDSWAWNLFWLVINTFFALALFVPIAILMVLLIVRVGYLWVVVAISPIIVLVEYGLDKGIKEKFKFISEKFSVAEVLKLIFSPIVVVFVVSLCIVFLATIYKSKPNYDNEETTLSAFWIEQVKTVEDTWENGTSWWSSSGCVFSWQKNVSSETYSILWIMTVKLNAQNYNHWLSLFAWVLVELVATAMVWFFMKFAIWAMEWKLLWDMWSKLMKSAQSFIESVPIVPLPGWKWAIGLGKLKDIEPASIIDRYTDAMNRESDDKLRERFPWAYPGSKSSSNNGSWNGVSAAEIQSVVDEIQGIKGKSLTSLSLTDLSSTAQATLNAMYWADAGANLANFINYHITNKATYTNIVQAGKTHWWTPTAWKTNADAVKFTDTQMDMAVKNDPNWKSWAWSIVWSSVQLLNWVYMVDYVKWTETTTPQYRIISREQYEKDHFGNQTIDTIDKATYDKNQGEIDKYLTELKEELDKLTELQNKSKTTPLNTQEKDLLAQLQKLQAELTSKTYIADIKTQLGI